MIIHAKHEVNLWKFTDVFLEDTIGNVSSFLSGNDNRYATLAEQLRQRITDIKIKIDRQLRLLDALKSQVKDQVVVIQRLEVSKIFIEMFFSFIKNSEMYDSPFKIKIKKIIIRDS